MLPVKTKSDEAAIDKGCYFDLKAADRVRFFFERFLRHSKGEFAGKKFELLEWEWEGVIKPIFGWKMPDGTRRFRRAGVAVPKKNGKSTLLSGIGLYMLCGDGEPGSEVYSAAAGKDQASIIFNEAANMVEASNALVTRIHLRKQIKEMRYGTSSYNALSADVPTKDGLNIHCLLFDELHTQSTWDLWNTLRYGFAARRQPLLFWITTAGIYSPESLCLDQWKYARGVQSGEIVDIGFLPCIYEARETDDWTSEETFARANPSYGVTISRRDWEESVTLAKKLPREEGNFKRYRLNQWTQVATRWIQAGDWEACKVPYEPAKGTKCYCGLDLAATTDIAAASFLFQDGGELRLKQLFWVPEAALERRRRENKVLLDAWIGKYIRVAGRRSIDYAVIRRDLNEWADKWPIRIVAIDPWNATQLSTELEGDGFRVEAVRQGFYTISAATKEFEKRLLARTLTHDGDPVMAWMVGNVMTEQDASGNIKPSKRRSKEKIDGVTSLITVLSRVIAQPVKRRSVYEDRGIEYL